jgi:hypothetical protein
MSTITSKFVVTGLLLTFTLISGVFLSNSGKPYNGVIFTVHKLIALATVVVIAVNIYQLQKVGGVGALVELALFSVIGLLFLALFVSGALLSIGNLAPEISLTIHKVFPLLVVFSTVAAFYLLSNSVP